LKTTIEYIQKTTTTGVLAAVAVLKEITAMMGVGNYS
jgi:hypothetical protein